jgi:hypothetical protein
VTEIGRGPTPLFGAGMARLARILAVTAGLCATGAVVGAVCGAAAGAAILLARDGPRGLLTPGTGNVLAVSAAVGAAVGTVAGPALAWALLRHVPLGRAVAGTTLGTVAGAAAGEWLGPFNPYSRGAPGVIVGALLGFLAAGVALRVHAARERRAGSGEGAG